MAAWEKEREILEWRSAIEGHNAQPPVEAEERIELRLMLTTNEGKLQYRGTDQKEFEVLSQKADLSRFLARYEEGGLMMDAASELLWNALVQNWNVTDDLRFRLDSVETCRLLHRSSMCRRPVPLLR